MSIDHPAATDAPRPFLVLETELGQDAVSVSVSGELDVGTAPLLKGRLDQIDGNGVRRILLDLAEVTFIDSLAVSLILAARTRLEPDGRLAILVRHPNVEMVFDVAGLEDVLRVFRSADEAKRYLLG